MRGKRYGFRFAARNKARALPLKGYVENLSDGSVRAVIVGKADLCNTFIHWCREGSGYSWVDRLDIKEMKPETFSAFSIRY